MSDPLLETTPDPLAHARALHTQGQLAAAHAACLQVLERHPSHVDALAMLGVLAGQSGDFAEAVNYFNRAVEAAPGDVSSYCNRGLALQQLREWDAALASFDQAIMLQPDHALSLFGRANLHMNCGRADHALADYGRAIAVSPGFFQAFVNRATLLHRLGRVDAALQNYDRAIELRPDVAMIHVHRGNALKDLFRPQEALENYQRAIVLDPQFAEVHSNCGIVLRELGRIEEALDSFDRAIALKPDYADAYVNRAALYRILKRLESAVADYEMAARLDPSIRFIQGASLEANLQICDWRDFDAKLAKIDAGIEAGAATSHPFAYMTFSDSPQQQRRAAEIWVRETCPADAASAVSPRRESRAKIRVGYFSADFREHPVSRLLAELIETHDRSRFDVFGFSFGEDTRDALRRRLEQGFDRFLDVREKSPREIAALARSLEIDIAVDLGGHTHSSRPEIFARRAAPVQVSYLGYLGTLAARYMDYLIADETIIPSGSRQYYTEKILYLPSYQANDSRRPVADRIFTRTELGLPESGFVYCCFNGTYKFNPAIFDSWMRILKRVDGSVLFLLSGNRATEINLIGQAIRRGMDPARIVFGGALPGPEYRARYRAADLFLDTRPYNAGTTASDALWVGLPVLTCPGKSFSSRVAASLLNALDLPELISPSEADYEDSAVELALNRQRLASIKAKLSHNRLGKPLFDTPLLAKHLEEGFIKIHERHVAGLAPEHITVASM